MRTADASPDLDLSSQGQVQAPPDRLYSGGVFRLLRRAFTPRGVDFFRFYIDLRKMAISGIIPDDIKQQYLHASKMLFRVRSPVDGKPLSPSARNILSDSRPLLNTQFNRLLGGKTEDPIVWRKINEILTPLLVAVARDKEVYLKTQRRGRERWSIFHKMSGRQEKTERLRDDDPESFELMERYGKTIDEIDAAIQYRITRSGEKYKKGFVMGRPIHMGIDRETGEERVYDRDGDVLEFEDYVEKRKLQQTQTLMSARIATRTTVALSEVRSLSDDAVDNLSGDIHWTSLTDDKAKQGRLTRVLPTRLKPVVIAGQEGVIRVEKVPVIVSGRYKGVFLDDMVNSVGRMIEGTAYTYSPTRNRSVKVPKRIDPAQREPYVTAAKLVTEKKIGFKTYEVEEDKLFLKIPGTKQYKELRHAVKKLACNAGQKTGCIPSISYHAIPGTKAAGFYFSPKDFHVILDTIQSMSLSKGALKAVKTYYEDLSRAEEATAKKNLGHFSAENLGGFKKSLKQKDGTFKPFDFLVKQKQSIAWLEARGDSGVCALETGVGKTMVAMGTMQKLVRDGLADEDATYETPDGRIIDTNGRFLFVCPTSLKGSLPKEIRTFMPDAKAMLSRVDIISYSEWARSCKSGRVPRSLRGVPYWRARRKQFGVIKQARRAPQVWESKVIWTPALYTALFFDEAHLLANPDSNSFKAANLVYHPRKILLTASPMKKNPKEAYLLASITNNIPLATHNPNDPKKALAVIDPRVVVDDVQKKLNRSEMRRFFDRFTETVGGRIVGVKQDPMVKHDMDVWVKQNVFHADKTNVEEFKLPELVSETMAIEMDPVVETLYRDTTQTFSRIMRGLVSKFRDRGRDPDTGHLLPEASDPNVERLFGQKFKPVVELLNNLANHPDDAMKDIAHMMDTGKMPKPDHNGEPIPVSPIFYKALHGWRTQFSSNLLRKHAEGVVNPKIEAAADRVTMKAIQTGSSSRTLLFSDDKKLCMKTGAQMSAQMPGWHGVALNDAIYIFEGGSQVHEIQYAMDPDLLAKLSDEQRDEVMSSTRGLTRIHVPFSQRAYRKHPDLPKDSKLNRHNKPNQWQQFVIREVIIPDANVKTMTLYGPTYQYGHNLQAFDTVIHLDRDHWDSENMKQRTARSWRQGQDQPVEEVTIDATFRASDEGLPREEFDRTLDEIRRYLQELQSDVFDRIIRDAQGIHLGEEWQEMTRRDSSNWRLDHKVLDLMMSPYVGRSQPPGVDR